MQTRPSGGLEPTTYHGRAKDARPSKLDSLARAGIAQMCPLDEGFAVYVSRSALQSIDSLPQSYLSECERVPDIGAVAEKQDLQNGENRLFLAYPNPNNGVLTLEFNSSEELTGTVTLYDVVGHTVFSEALRVVSGTSEIHLTGIPTGLYLLKVVVNDRLEQTERISVIRQ